MFWFGSSCLTTHDMCSSKYLLVTHKFYQFYLRLNNFYIKVHLSTKYLTTTAKNVSFNVFFEEICPQQQTCCWGLFECWLVYGEIMQVVGGPILKLISIQFYVRLAKGFPIINLHLHIRSLIILMLLIPQSEMNTGLPLGWSSGTKFQGVPWAHILHQKIPREV